MATDDSHSQLQHIDTKASSLANTSLYSGLVPGPGQLFPEEDPLARLAFKAMATARTCTPSLLMMATSESASLARH